MRLLAKTHVLNNSSSSRPPPRPRLFPLKMFLHLESKALLASVIIANNESISNASVYIFFTVKCNLVGRETFFLFDIHEGFQLL